MKNFQYEHRHSKVEGSPIEMWGRYLIKHHSIPDYWYHVVVGIDQWEHVSVTLQQRAHNKWVDVKRCPTWSEMCFLKNFFWEDDEMVVQIHPPKTDHVNIHPYCLHLWRATEEVMPSPPKIFV